MAKTVRTAKLPSDDDRCGWWHLLPEQPPPRRLETDEIADCIVVGAGFTGLACARRLAGLRPIWRIAVLEAQRAGYGASGRNSGFAGDIAHRDPAAGMEKSLRHKRLAGAGIAELRRLVEGHGVDCDWNEGGRFHTAVEGHGVRNFELLLGVLEQSREPHTVMSEEALADAIGTTYYRRAVHVHATVLLQPAALAVGLARTLPENVVLYEESPVREMRRAEKWTLRAGNGSVTADRVFLAVNGFAPALGLLRRRVFPLFTFASMTRPLTTEEQRQVGSWREWGIVSEDRMGSTLRCTRDHRIFVRNTVRYSPSLRASQEALRKARGVHRKSLLARWPSLAGVELEYTWGGLLGMTMNQGQFFGRLGDGLYASAGYNGTGVAMGSASGMLLADYALGQDSELLGDALSLPRPRWIPPEPFLGWGVRWTVAFLQQRAGAER